MDAGQQHKHNALRCAYVTLITSARVQNDAFWLPCLPCVCSLFCPVGSRPGFVRPSFPLGVGLVVRSCRARSVRVDQKHVVLNAGVSPTHLPAPVQTLTFKATRFVPGTSRNIPGRIIRPARISHTCTRANGDNAQERKNSRTRI